MILTGAEIRRQVLQRRITLDPFDDELLNPNSYNYRLGNSIVELRDNRVEPLSNSRSAWRSRRIPESGFVLQPKRFYLATTQEVIGSDNYVPLLIGRSSMGRLGLFLQISADLGQLGSAHRWTLELVAVQPLRIYPGMRIGQVSFWRCQGGALAYTGYFGRESEPTITPSGYNVR